ncbi:MAG: SIR2 family protein [Candidatus Thiodiazotropha sp. (ex Codakia rugifera)]|nr:SIR2 family protein [Candidatus Thiodiazotropha sp. (ex Codakia rugifera)]
MKLVPASHSPDCVICKQHLDFELPKELLTEILSGQFALFAGAGISQELPEAGSPTFYSSILDSLGLEKAIPFPDLMEKFCGQTNGRLKLLSRIKDHFDKINSFSELRRYATRFHHEIATFFPLQTIVTTNWDTFFEDVCAATPFVTPMDLAFWNAPGRKVLKIHGSLSNYGSIIATSSDYKKRKRELDKSVFGSTLKHILATQTVIFAGYSCRDSDFLSIYQMIRKELGLLHKQAYILTLDFDSDERYRELGLVPIYTDATYFFSIIKEHAAHDTNHYLPDKIYDEVEKSLFITRKVHHKLLETVDFNKHTDALFSVFYQDGLIHGFDRILNKRCTGTYSHTCDIIAQVDLYKKILKQMRKKRRYDDVAYIEGYLNAIRFPVLFEDVDFTYEDVPLFFGFGIDEDIMSLSEYLAALPNLASSHKAAHRRSMQIAKHFSTLKDIVPHHPPIISMDLEPLGIHE